LTARTLPGTRSHHSFTPISDTELHMRRLSSDVIYNTIYFDGHKQTNCDLEYQPGRYIACLYDGQWYVGNIVERSDTNHDILVKFMKRNGINLSWPPESRKDECWVLFTHVMCHKSTGSSGQCWSTVSYVSSRLRTCAECFCIIFTALRNQ
jgi:hypothetical protein